MKAVQVVENPIDRGFRKRAVERYVPEEIPDVGPFPRDCPKTGPDREKPLDRPARLRIDHRTAELDRAFQVVGAEAVAEPEEPGRPERFQGAVADRPAAMDRPVHRDDLRFHGIPRDKLLVPRPLSACEQNSRGPRSETGLRPAFRSRSCTTSRVSPSIPGGIRLRGAGFRSSRIRSISIRGVSFRVKARLVMAR